MASRRSPSFAAVLALLAAHSAPLSAQLVPEGIHSDADGPADLCGLVAPDAEGVIALLRSSPLVRAERIDSARFELFVAREGITQWVATRASEPAHPAVTCRRLIEDKDGNLLTERQMRCDAERLPCDRLFLEFQALDERLREELNRQAD